MSLDALNAYDPELVVILQLEGAGFLSEYEARANLKRVLPDDFIWDEPTTTVANNT